MRWYVVQVGSEDTELPEAADQRAEGGRTSVNCAAKVRSTSSYRKQFIFIFIFIAKVDGGCKPTRAVAS